jgi:ABC-2 type transport system permease protein
MRWSPHVFSLEVRKLFSYRVDFWLSFLVAPLGDLALAYFLWKAVFEARGVTSLGGYTFGAMMIYYLGVAMINRMVRGEELGFMSQEIYDGSLTRYLVYPVSFFGYKFVAYLARFAVLALQLAAAVCVFLAIFGMPEGTHVTPWSILAAIGASVLAGYLYFALTSILEMVAFWADNVWSLLVMLRFAASLLGGGLIPLTLFPEWSRAYLEALPFPYLISFPVRCLLGQADGAEWSRALAVTLAWALMATIASGVIWRRGTRQYTGVGI